MTVTTTTEPRDRELRAAAAEVAEVAERVKAIGDRLTATLLDPALTASALRSPVTGLPALRALARALTHARGLGFAFGGGLAGGTASRIAGFLGTDSLAVLIAITSLRLRISAVGERHPALFGDPVTRGLIDAVTRDRDIETARLLRTMLNRRGVSQTLATLAPIAMEVMALKALLDGNPFNDGAAWALVTGRLPDTEPLLGVPTRAITAWDRGEGAAERAEDDPGLGRTGGLLEFLADLAVLGNNGRAVVQQVRGPDGVCRYVVLAPGMQVGRPITPTPQDLVGAWRNTVQGSSPYVGALMRAVADFGVPDGAELTLVGHSEGGAAVMNLAQHPGFCRRYRVRHVLAVGAPVDFKTCADPRTRVASITNQNDLVPALDGLGAGSPFARDPSWYVVDYTDTRRPFPQCHNIRAYLANLRDDLPEARAELTRRLAPFTGRAVRTQVYRLWDRARPPSGFPFLTVPTHPVPTSAGEIPMPVKLLDGAGLVCVFAVPEELVPGGLPGSVVRVGGRALVALSVFEHRDGTLGAFKEISCSVVLHDPWRERPLRVWPDLLARAGGRRSGVYVLERALTSDKAMVVGREVWGLSCSRASVTLRMAGGRAAVAVHPPDRHLQVVPAGSERAKGMLAVLTGTLGPGVPLPHLDSVVYSELAGSTLRSHVEIHGTVRAHPLSALRLRVGGSPHPFAALLRGLRLDGARPLITVGTTACQARLGAGTPIAIPDKELP
ncbi:acetoacetate decarboxylase family protein [Nonomuraea longicatena]|uniref:Uncharacterized protein n=1 Tax=Nonomuraea longicatena TaxID=83682 RepID=A0ABP4B0V7_9ACTN